MARLNVDVIVRTAGQGLRDLEGLGGKLQRTGFNLTKFVTLPLLGVAGASVAMAADAEKSGAKLEAAFKNMGKTSGKTLAQLEEQAVALGEATTFDDEGIMEAQAALITFGAVSGDAFDRAIQASADFAAATGKDLTTATQMLGKALADPEAGLSRLTRAGIVFTEQQKEQVAALTAAGDTLGAQEVILAAFEARYAGVNAQLQNTGAGQAAQAFEDLQNAGEEIGAVFLPVLASLAQGLSSVARWFTELPPGMQQFIVIFGGIIAAIGPAVFVIGKLVSSFQAVIAVFNLLKIALLTNPFTALAVAVAAIAALIILNWDKIWEFLQKTWQAIMTALSTLSRFFGAVWDGIVKMTTDAWNSVVNIIKGVLNGLIDVINGFFGFLNGLSFGAGPWDVGPIHIDAIAIDPFNIGLIPHLAEGGIINGPTLALLGEAGPEAVVPLTRQGEFGNHFHSHIEVRGEEPFIRNEEDLVRVQQRIAFLEGF